MNILYNNGKYSFYNSLDIRETLEKKNYTLSFDAFYNCFLEDEQPFKLSTKLYDVDGDLWGSISYQIEQKTIDDCEYIIIFGVDGRNIIHKANCKNPVHVCH